MKQLIISTASILLIMLAMSCNKKSDCNNSKVCQEQPPKDEACLAFFQRWFYNNTTQKCELIAYSGCSDKGFKTEAECNQCDCKK